MRRRKTRTTKTFEDGRFEGIGEIRFLRVSATQTRRGISSNSEKQRCIPVRRKDLGAVESVSSSNLYYTHPLSAAYDPPGAFDRRRDVSKWSRSLTRVLMNINFVQDNVLSLSSLLDLLITTRATSSCRNNSPSRNVSAKTAHFDERTACRQMIKLKVSQHLCIR